MEGLAGVRMWMEDFLINLSSYDEQYRRNFVKINKLFKECRASFKASKSIGESNHNYEIYEEKLEDLREDIANDYGSYDKIPLGISDTLDYFEEAIGDLDDKTIDNLIKNSKGFSIILQGFGSNRDSIIKEFQLDYPEVNFSKQGSIDIKVSGSFYDVRSFLEEEYTSDVSGDLIDQGEFENA